MFIFYFFLQNLNMHRQNPEAICFLIFPVLCSQVIISSVSVLLPTIHTGPFESRKDGRQIIHKVIPGFTETFLKSSNP